MLAEIGRLLLNLHRDSRAPSVEGFPRWAMDQLATAIPFDSAFWGSGCQIDGQIVVHTWWLHSLPQESMLAWEAIKHRDTIGPFLVAAPGQVIKLDRNELEARHQEFFRGFLDVYGIRQFMGTYAPNAATGIYDAISLYRSDKGNPFSETERQAFECLVPNLIEVRRSNYLYHLAIASASASAPVFHRAAADDKGVLHASEDGFARLIAAEWPDWRGPRLPAVLADIMNARGTRFLGKQIAIELRRPLDTTLLYGRARLALDDLSFRQIEIAQAFADGLTHKEIAKSYSLSPATVRNHLGAIYQTLGIGGKAELASLLTRNTVSAMRTPT